MPLRAGVTPFPVAAENDPTIDGVNGVITLAYFVSTLEDDPRGRRQSTRNREKGTVRGGGEVEPESTSF
jgi:hypothetical protein